MLLQVLPASLIAAWVAVVSSPVLMSGEPIVHVDLYGVRTVSEESVHRALDAGLGDDIEFDRDAAEARLEALPGIADAEIILMPMPGNAIVLVGIEEVGAVKLGLDPAPTGEVRLPEALVELYDGIMDLGLEAIYAGESREDRVDGFALSVYEPLREKELELVELAQQHAELLPEVLRDSSDAVHRAVAAHSIAALEDKQLVQRALARAMRDADAGVRNNATRALLVLSDWANDVEDVVVEIDVEPAIEMLESITWTDRNKAAGLLFHLSEQRSPALLATLRERSVPALAEMARWSSEGHSYTSRMLLGRVAGVGETELQEAEASLTGPERSAWIDRMVQLSSELQLAE